MPPQIDETPETIIEKKLHAERLEHEITRAKLAREEERTSDLERRLTEQGKTLSDHIMASSQVHGNLEATHEALRNTEKLLAQYRNENNDLHDKIAQMAEDAAMAAALRRGAQEGAIRIIPIPEAASFTEDDIYQMSTQLAGIIHNLKSMTDQDTSGFDDFEEKVRFSPSVGTIREGIDFILGVVVCSSSADEIRDQAAVMAEERFNKTGWPVDQGHPLVQGHSGVPCTIVDDQDIAHMCGKVADTIERLSAATGIKIGDGMSLVGSASKMRDDPGIDNLRSGIDFVLRIVVASGMTKIVPELTPVDIRDLCSQVAAIASGLKRKNSATVATKLTMEPSLDVLRQGIAFIGAVATRAANDAPTSVSDPDDKLRDRAASLTRDLQIARREIDRLTVFEGQCESIHRALVRSMYLTEREASLDAFALVGEFLERYRERERVVERIEANSPEVEDDDADDDETDDADDPIPYQVRDDIESGARSFAEGLAAGLRDALAVVVKAAMDNRAAEAFTAGIVAGRGKQLTPDEQEAAELLAGRP